MSPVVTVRFAGELRSLAHEKSKQFEAA